MLSSPSPLSPPIFPSSLRRRISSASRRGKMKKHHTIALMIQCFLCVFIMTGMNICISFGYNMRFSLYYDNDNDNYEETQQRQPTVLSSSTSTETETATGETFLNHQQRSSSNIRQQIYNKDPRFNIDYYQRRTPNNDDDDKPPSNFFIKGKRSKYTPCPKPYRKHVFVAHNTFGRPVHRAFTTQKWQVTTNYNDLFSPTTCVIWKINRLENVNNKFKPYHRYNRLDNYRLVDRKDQFIEGFQNYAKKQQQLLGSGSKPKKSKKKKNPIYFLPETYRITSSQQDLIEFRNVIQKEITTELRYRPWVIKETSSSRGKSIQMIGPNQHMKLNKAIEDAIEMSLHYNQSYIVQEYICNELTWYQNQKFDLRFYFLVASLDPLIVLFHDGFVRVGDSQYNETNFSNSKTHLTNSAQNKPGLHHQQQQQQHNTNNNNNNGSGNNNNNKSSSSYNTSFPPLLFDEEDVLADALWRRINQHYQDNYDYLSKRLARGMNITTTNDNDDVDNNNIDPIRYVRNQLKDAISSTVAAFKHTVFTINTTTVDKLKGPENRFALWGCDFIIDADLDVWYVEAQAGPQLKDDNDFRIDLYRHMLIPMVNIIEEISNKQWSTSTSNTTASSSSTSYWPLKTNIGSWDVVYLSGAANGNDGTNNNDTTKKTKKKTTKTTTNTWRYQFTEYQRYNDDKKGCM